MLSNKIQQKIGNKMIDLYMHTKYSDGTWSVEETLRKAQR